MKLNENREVVLLWNLNQPIIVHNTCLIVKFCRGIEKSCSILHAIITSKNKI